MTPAFATLLAIIGVILSGIPIYFLAKTNARESRRQRNEEVAVAVQAAVAPVQAALEQAQQDVRDRDRRIEAKDGRIEALEDQLREAR